MCGIIAIAGRGATTARLLEGIRRLEYRGYDSAGLAVVDGAGKLERRRTAGKVADLANVLAVEPVDGTTGVAHTRWATHGAANESNAHPHRAGRALVVHNGIIENFLVLKNELK